MRTLTRYLMTLSLIGLVGCGSGEAPAGDPGAPGGGKADDTNNASGPTVAYGLYTAYLEDDMVNRTPLLLAFHKVAAGLPEGYAGAFDLSFFNEAAEKTSYLTGIFRPVRQEGRLFLDLKASTKGAPDGAAGKIAGWRYDAADQSYNQQVEWISDGTGCSDLVTPEGSFSFCPQKQLPENERQCLAFQIKDYVFEEGFTEWEYPDVDIDRDENGRWQVWLGSALFDSEEAEITVSTGRSGDFEATVNVEGGETYVVRIPAGIPSRGEVLIGETGGALQPLARIVCFPAAK